MSRARKLGAFASVLALAGLVAGCGSGQGYTAAESTPTSTPAPAAPAATGAAPTVTPSSVIGTFSPADATARDQTFKGYSRFPKDRAGKIFVDPTVKPAPATPAVTPAAPAPVTSVPLAPTTTTPTPTPAPAPSPAKPVAVTTTLTASLDISGTVETVRVNAQVPSSSPQFTVQAITADTVTLRANSGTFPGGGSTLDIKKGESVSLTNPGTNTALVIKVVEIKKEA